METLPVGIKFLSNGYGEGLDLNIKTSEMDSGLKKMRPGRSKPIRIRKGSLLIGSSQNKLLFEAFILRVKTQYFNYEDPIHGGIKKCRFINEKWEFSLEGNTVWRAQCEMESVG